MDFEKHGVGRGAGSSALPEFLSVTAVPWIPVFHCLGLTTQAWLFGFQRTERWECRGSGKKGKCGTLICGIDTTKRLVIIRTISVLYVANRAHSTVET